MTLCGIFFSRYSRMRSSFPVNLVVVDNFPFGLPNRLPSLFLRAKASLVREEIIDRSISAESEKAKARTLEEISEFIPIKQSVTKGSGAPGSCAGHNSVLSRDRGRPPSTGGSGPSRSDTA